MVLGHRVEPDAALGQLGGSGKTAGGGQDSQGD